MDSYLESPKGKESTMDKKKGTKSARPKTLKIGFLFVEEKGRVKKTFKNRFCFLTDACEIEWYKKQEDSVDHKRAGAFKNLDTCEISEVEEANNVYAQYNQFCFTVKTGNKTHYFGAVDHQDRMNWMVEILKLRPIPDILGLLESPTLSRHAAFALANLSGSKAEGVQTNIVKFGGVDHLVKYLNKVHPTDDKLLDTIFYSIQKLCEKDVNKLEIGKNYGQLYDVFAKGEQERKVFIAKSIYLCTLAAENKSRLRDSGGLQWIFKQLCDKDIGERAKTPLAETFLIAMENNDENKLAIVDTILPSFMSNVANIIPPIQIILIEMFTKCAETTTLLERMKKQTILPALFQNSLITSKNIKLQEAAVSFVALLASNDNEQHKNKGEIRDNKGLENLVASLSSESTRVKEDALSALYSFVFPSEEYSVELAKLGEGLIPLIEFLGSDNQGIQGKTHKIVLNISSFDRSRKILCKSEKTVAVLLIGFVSASEMFVREKLLSLQNFSLVDEVKLQMCKHPILDHVIERLTKREPVTINCLMVLANCTAIAFTKQALASKPSALKLLIPLLQKSEDERIQENAAKIFANCTIERNTARVIRDIGGLQALILALESKNESVQQYSARAIANLAYIDEIEEVILDFNGIKPLVALIPSQNLVVRENVCLALRNCSIHDKNKTEISNLGGIKAIIDILESPNPRIQEHAALILRNCLSKEGVINDVGKVGGLKPLLTLASSRDIRVVENALWALCYCNDNFQDKLTIVKLGGIRLFLNSIEFANERVKEYAAQVVADCLKRPQRQTEVHPKALEKMFSLLSTANAKVLENLLSVIYSASKNEKMRALVSEGTKHLHQFLQSSNQKVRYYAAGALINNALNENGEVELKTVGGLASLLTNPDIKISHSNSWKIKMAPNDDQKKIEIYSPKQPVLSFQFNNPKHMKYRLARCLSYCYYGLEYDGEKDSKPKPEELEKSSPTSTEKNEEEHKEEPFSGVWPLTFPSPSTSSLTSPSATAKTPSEERPQTDKPEDEEKAKTGQVRQLAHTLSRGQLTVGSAPGPTTQPKVPPPRRFTPGTPSQSHSQLFAMGSHPQVGYGPPKNPPPQPPSSTPSATPPAPQKQRSFNQVTAGAKRKSASLTRGKGKTKVTRTQLEAIAHYRCLLNPTFAKHLDSVLSYLREINVKECDPLEEVQDPPKLNYLTKRCGAAVVVENSCLTVRYIGGDMSITGVVQAVAPIATNVSWYYFEVLIVSGGTRGTIGVGFACQNYPLDQQPGWQSESYACHGDDGNKFSNGEHNRFGPRFTTGDVVGCGYNNVTKEIFYTKNGQFVGVAFENCPNTLYPTIGLASPGERVHINFGQTPFLFDFNFTVLQRFVIAPKAETGREMPPLLAEKSSGGDIGAALDSYASEWNFLHPVRLASTPTITQRMRLSDSSSLIVDASG